jgi:hypothetical protein
MSALLPLAPWVPILDGDAIGRALYERHYSAKKSLANRMLRGTRLFVGPGHKLVLSTPDRMALFVWRRERFRLDLQRGVNCAIFRNEGGGIASDLIRVADSIADERWPGERHFTFVDPAEVRGNPPGNCFLRAGWRRCGTTATGLHILERMPA